MKAIASDRAEAAARFQAQGVPHRRIEEWKYSDLRAIVSNDDVVGAGAAEWVVESRSDSVELFDLAGAGEMPDWVRRHVAGIATGAMDAASFAFSNSGYALRLAKGMQGAVRMRMPSAGQARIVIVVDEDATLNLLESGAAAIAGLQNIGMDIVLAAGATLHHVRLAPENRDAVQVAEISVTAAARASYKLHVANMGARLSRTELRIVLDGKEANAHLSGVSVLGRESHSDITSHIEHAVGDTMSTQLFKLVAGGKSRAVYQGKISVREGADGSDSRQTAKALLLGIRAEADLKPELEIFADDVKCAHGAAVGDLDPESLFYLRSRGVPENEARNMLIRAFVEDAVMHIADEAIRASVWQAVEEALPRAMEAA